MTKSNNGTNVMAILEDCPCSGATLDKLVQPSILTALTQGPMHGYRLAQRINERAGTCGEKPDVSGIYRCLKKMEASGLVTSSWEAGDKGHARRLFEITAAGRACLVRWTSTLESYMTSVGKLLNDAKTGLARKPKRVNTGAP
jgi:PadR family transcriptional regulator, regulatory protein PadR